MQDLVKAASAFAHAAHAACGQVRRYTGDDYIIHPHNVAEMVARSGHGTPEVVAAAWLHDVVEDCPGIDAGMIEYFFGPKVRALVVECSHIDRKDDPRKLNRFERMAIELARAADISPEAKTIKLADLLDNTASIAAHDPKFAKVYMAEKRRLVMVLMGGDQGLWIRAATQVNEYFFPKPVQAPIAAKSAPVAPTPIPDESACGSTCEAVPLAVDADGFTPGKPDADGLYLRKVPGEDCAHFARFQGGVWYFTASREVDALSTLGVSYKQEGGSYKLVRLLDAAPAVDPATVWHGGEEKPTQDGIYVRGDQSQHISRWEHGRWGWTCKDVGEACSAVGAKASYTQDMRWRGPVAEIVPAPAPVAAWPFPTGHGSTPVVTRSFETA